MASEVPMNEWSVAFEGMLYAVTERQRQTYPVATELLTPFETDLTIICRPLRQRAAAMTEVWDGSRGGVWYKRRWTTLDPGVEAAREQRR